MKKIAFFDIDGTLLKNDQMTPSPKIIHTLKELKRNYYLICMATGRTYPEIVPLKNIPFDIIIAYNGSYIEYNHQVIYRQLLNKSDLSILLNNLKIKNKISAISDKQTIYLNGLDPILNYFFTIIPDKVKLVNDFNDLLQQDIYQITCAIELDEYDKILQGTSYSKISSWSKHAGDIIHKNSGKGNAVKFVLNYFHIDRQYSIAFGDSSNDIEMLQSVNTGIAMGNSDESVKKIAKDTCPTVDEDGIYDYCLQNHLIKKPFEK